MNRPLGRVALGILLPAGAGLTYLVSSVMAEPQFTARQWLLLAAVLASAQIPQMQRWFNAALEPLRQPPARTRVWTAGVVAAAAVLLLGAAALWSGRPLYAQWADEQCYLVQMRMLALGRLWMPQHPVAGAFEAFYLLVKPKYAAMYFPGTALLYVAAIWLHLPYVLLPLLAAGAVVGLVYDVVTRMLDGVAGLLAALLLLASVEFGRMSTMVMSQVPVLLLGLLLIEAWLHWRQRPAAGKAAVMGLLAGWAAITRPVDALCFLLPVAAAVMLDFVEHDARTRRTTLIAGAAGLLPLLIIQAVFNLGVTGNVLETPHHFYTHQFAPGVTYGFHPLDPQVRPAGNLPQKQAIYDQFIAPAIERHRVDHLWQTWRGQRLAVVLNVALCHPALAALIPVGLLGMGKQRRWVLGLGGVLFMALYAGYAFMQPYYPVPAAPALIFAALLSGRVLEQAWPRRQAMIATALALLVIVEVAAWAPAWARQYRSISVTWPTMAFVEKQLPKLVQQPAVVLFRFTAETNWQEEPVYNAATAWPDDAAIVRAHALGREPDRRLVDYYAGSQPGRHFYLYHRGTGGLAYLGTAADLAQRMDRQHDH